ncbi:hypothetical protein C8R45DRAFT_937057 [Mycena sanguinolenta]|nr:hypothetical protein C8R45DRAFT_937057 [Mycena sanguinolenta]
MSNVRLSLWIQSEQKLTWFTISMLPLETSAPAVAPKILISPKARSRLATFRRTPDSATVRPIIPMLAVLQLGLSGHLEKLTELQVNGNTDPWCRRELDRLVVTCGVNVRARETQPPDCVINRSLPEVIVNANRPYIDTYLWCRTVKIESKARDTDLFDNPSKSERKKSKKGPRTLPLNSVCDRSDGRERWQALTSRAVHRILDVPGFDGESDNEDEEEEEYEEPEAETGGKKRKPKPPRGAVKRRKTDQTVQSKSGASKEPTKGRKVANAAPKPRKKAARRVKK